MLLGLRRVPRGVQGVAKNFREVFRDLAPGGRGELVMQKRLRRPQEEGGHAGGEAAEGDEDEGETPGTTEKYSGVKVRVRASHLSPRFLLCHPEAQPVASFASR